MHRSFNTTVYTTFHLAWYYRNIPSTSVSSLAITTGFDTGAAKTTENLLTQQLPH